MNLGITHGDQRAKRHSRFANSAKAGERGKTAAPSSLRLISNIRSTPLSDGLLRQSQFTQAKNSSVAMQEAMANLSVDPITPAATLHMQKHGIPGSIYRYPVDNRDPTDDNLIPYAPCFFTEETNSLLAPGVGTDGRRPTAVFHSFAGRVYNPARAPRFMGFCENRTSHPSKGRYQGPSDNGTCISAGLVTLYANTLLKTSLNPRVGHKVAWMCPEQGNEDTPVRYGLGRPFNHPIKGHIDADRGKGIRLATIINMDYENSGSCSQFLNFVDIISGLNDPLRRDVAGHQYDDGVLLSEGLMFMGQLLRAHAQDLPDAFAQKLKQLVDRQAITHGLPIRTLTQMLGVDEEWINGLSTHLAARKAFVQGMLCQTMMDDMHSRFLDEHFVGKCVRDERMGLESGSQIDVVVATS